jgi:anti-sigma factor RsiW
MDDPMTTDRFNDLLSSYLDRELDQAVSREVERHVASCPTCAKALEELRAVKDRARTLVDAPPGADLWPGIAARIGGDRGGSFAIRPLPRVGARLRTGRRFALSLPQLAAAAVLVALVSAGAVWLALHRPGTATVAREATPRRTWTACGAFSRRDGSGWIQGPSARSRRTSGSSRSPLPSRAVRSRRIPEIRTCADISRKP